MEMTDGVGADTSVIVGAVEGAEIHNKSYIKIHVLLTEYF